MEEGEAALALSNLGQTSRCWQQRMALDSSSTAAGDSKCSKGHLQRWLEAIRCRRIPEPVLLQRAQGASVSKLHHQILHIGMGHI